jgi:predicted DNA-binding transcriptional regulator YafY
MGETVLRQWLVLAMLPRPPRRIDSGSIEARLRDRGIEVHRRTIQRDLLELAGVFPIVVDERAKPYGWRWSDDAQFQSIAEPLALTALRIDVRLRIRRPSLEELLGRLGAAHRRITNTNGDLVEVEIAIEDADWPKRLLLGYADEVEVLGPPAFRSEIAARAQRIVTLHER